MVWGVNRFIFFFNIWVSNFFSTICWKKLYLLCWLAFAPLRNPLTVLWLSVFFYRNLYWSFRQHQTVLIIIVLQYVLKSDNTSPPTWFFFKIVLAFLVSLLFHDFRITISVVTRILIGLTSSLLISLGRIYILTKLGLPVHEHNMSFHLFRSF